MDTMLSLRELCAQSPELDSLRTICIHEAGHAAVGRRYGHTAAWWVLPDYSDPDSPRLVGMTDLRGLATRRVDRLIGLAGIVATELDTCPFIHEDEIEESLHYGGIVLSKCDARLASGYKNKDIRDCIRTVMPLMPEIVEDAGRYLVRVFQRDESEAPEWARTLSEFRNSTQPGQTRNEQSRLSSPRVPRRVVGYY